MDLDSQSLVPVWVYEPHPCQPVKARIDRAIRDAGPGKPRDIFEKVWTAISADYDCLVEELKKLCLGELEGRGVSSSIFGRTKTLESILKSVDRREKHRLEKTQPPYQCVRDILDDVHDLAGIKIVLNFQNDKDSVEEFIDTYFRKVKEPTVFSADRDVGKVWKPWFGAYSSTNHKLCLNRPESEALSLYNDVLFELQVTDDSAHRYNTLAHPFLYKHSFASLTRGDEMVIDISHAVSRVYALCLMYMRDRVEGTDRGAEAKEELSRVLRPTTGTEIPAYEFTESMVTQDLMSVIGAPPDTCDSVGKLRLWLGEKWDEIRDANQASVHLRGTAGASYDSSENQLLLPCQPGTRTSILQTVENWVMDDDSETILWVYGPAGIGKSTISLTVARSLDDRGLLGASYFFKRGEDERSDASRFVPTLANQLMAAVPGFRKFLRESLDEPRNVDIEKKAMEVQFDALVRGPLSRVPTTESPHRLTRVIIIDALDECGLELEAKILRLFSKLEGLVNLRLRVLVTSRHTHRIGTAFEDLDGLPRKVYSKLALHSAFPEETREDIAVFLKEQFASIRKKKRISGDWPDPSDLDRVVNLATSPSPLFIYATTLCRFIYEGSGRVQPTKRLRGWLEQCDVNTSQLDQIYLPILNYVLFGSYNPGDKPHPLNADDQSELRQILSAIVFLATPLPRRAIAALLDIPEDSVDHHIENLHAVLDAPSDAPVRILHQSFRDFVVGYKGEDMSSILPFDEKEAHALLARQCIRLMENKPLKRDICDIDDPGRLRHEIKDTLVSEHISTELAYACRFWVHSQVLHGWFVHEEQVYKFLREHLLYWIECMSLLRRLPDGLSLIKKLSAACQLEPVASSTLATFLRDAETFIFTNGLIIARAPLQIYSSALAFTPTTSEVKKLLWKERFQFLDTIGGVKDTYSVTLKGHDSWVHALAFSPDGKTLSSASRDCTIRHWDTALGAHQRTLSNPTFPAFIDDIAFLPDGKTIISVSRIDGIRLWHPEMGVSQLTLELRRNSRTYIKKSELSPNMKSIALGLRTRQGGRGKVNYRVGLWDTTSGRCLWETGSVVAVSFLDTTIAFSPDGLLVAWGLNKVVSLLDSGNGTILRTLRHPALVYALSFSPDSKTVASGWGSGKIRLWDAWDGSHRDVATGHDDEIEAIAFSPNGKMIAVPLGDIVQLCDVQKGTILHTFKGHTNKVKALSFSPDGMTIASGSLDLTMRLWSLTSIGRSPESPALGPNVSLVVVSPDRKVVAGVYRNEIRLSNSRTGAHQRTLMGGPSQKVTAVAFSPNSKLVASHSWDTVQLERWDTVQLWDATTGARQHTLECNGRSECDLAFSPDGKMVAAASSHGFRLWNAAEGTSQRIFSGFESPDIRITFSPDGKTVIKRDAGKLTLWDMTIVMPRYEFKFGRRHMPDGVAFSPDSKTLALATHDRIFLLDTPEGTHRHTIWNRSAVFAIVAFSPDGKTLAMTSDNDIQFWYMGKITHLRTLKGHIYRVNLITFSPDGGTLASASYDQTVHLWHVATGAIQHTLRVQTGLITALAFSPSYNSLPSASSSRDRALALASCTGDASTIHLWDAATGLYQRTLEVHEGTVQNIAFLQGGAMIASRSDRCLQIWDIATGRCMTMREYPESRDIAVSSDFQTIAELSQGKSESVQCWDVATGARGHHLACTCRLPDSLFSFLRSCRWIRDDTGVIKAFSFSPEGKTLAASCGSALHLFDVATGNGRKLHHNDVPIHRASGIQRNARQPISGQDYPEEQESVGNALAVSGEWVTRRQKRILWIPSSYRACTAVGGDLVVLGHGSNIATLKFDFS